MYLLRVDCVVTFTVLRLCALCRSLCANLAAAEKYEISHLDQPEVTKVYENAQIVYISGFFVTVSPDTILKIAKYASDKKKVRMNRCAQTLSPPGGEGASQHSSCTRFLALLVSLDAILKVAKRAFVVM